MNNCKLTLSKLTVNRTSKSAIIKKKHLC